MEARYRSFRGCNLLGVRSASPAVSGPAGWAPLIAVAGASAPTEYQVTAAFKVGQVLAERGMPLICGGMGGVMDAAARGVANVSGGITIGLLPGMDILASSPHVTVPLATGLGEIRNAVLARASRAMIAIGGGYGTLTEIAFALRLHRPLALIDSWEFNHASMAADAPLLFMTSRRDDPLENAIAAVDWISAQLGL